MNVYYRWIRTPHAGVFLSSDRTEPGAGLKLYAITYRCLWFDVSLWLFAKQNPKNGFVVILK
jgi:hypothetical protein